MDVYSKTTTARMYSSNLKKGTVRQIKTVNHLAVTAEMYDSSCLYGCSKFRH